ncbi:MAG: hypothetical protein HY654_07310 [Acidobacteria bacterium]|nr:hypothetical protein [Acidobacteriota bacterium]
MLHPRTLVAALSIIGVLASPALAGEVRIDMRNGRVTLEVREATVQEILAEWARVGGATILNGEKIPSERVTLQLNDVPEMRALEIVLRSAAGFVAAPRRAGFDGVSTYDRIMVLATSSPPPVTAGYPQVPTPSGMVQPMPLPDSDMLEQTPPGMIRTPMYPGMPAGAQPGYNPQLGYTTQPGMMTPYQPATNPTGAINYGTQPGGAITISPQNPMGVYPGTSPVPGAIIVPQPTPGMPAVPPKPPGPPR